MNIPFPVIYPRMLDSMWFHSDNPIDEDAELTAMEVAQEETLYQASTSRFMKKQVPVGKSDSQLMEEADSDVEEGNEESDDTEESHDEEDEEEVRTSSTGNNNELEPDSLDDLNDSLDLNTSDQSTLWPVQ